MRLVASDPLRPGVTLPELILVAWLFGLVLAAVAGFAGAQARLAALTSDRVRAGEVVRIGHVVLGTELRPLGRPDVTALSHDSLRIRAIRGAGPICAADGADVLVRYRGVRLPDPEKDSVLVVHGGSGAGVALDILEVAADGGCEEGLRLGLAAPAPAPGGLALVFETGAYSTGAGALRYRRGAGGRQPLTETLLADADLIARTEASLSLELYFRSDSLPRLPALYVPLRIALPNRGVP